MGTQKNSQLDGSVEHPKHMLKMMDKKMKFYTEKCCLSKHVMIFIFADKGSNRFLIKTQKVS